MGGGDTIIMESCEYCNSFLNFFPTTAVVLNIEADHLDFFADLQDVERSFFKFASLVPADGNIVANGDDENTMNTLYMLHPITFGTREGNTIRGVNFSKNYQEFDVLYHEDFYCHMKLSLVGRHNAMNALAATAVGFLYGIEPDLICRALAGFTGAGRRMELKGRYHGADVYDDYAHHPGELKALFAAAKTMGYRRILCAFQPHTYSRTNALFSDFVEALKRVDQAIVAEIYAAREQNTIGISSKDLVAQIPGAVYCETLPDVTDYLKSVCQEGDLVLTVGAGDIYKAGEALFK